MKNGVILLDLVYVSLLKKNGRFDATKARQDITDTLTKDGGVKVISITRHTGNKIAGTLELVFKTCFKLARLPKNATIIIQYPMMGIRAFYWVSLLLKRFSTILVIHDLLSYRFAVKETEHKQEIACLNRMKHVIVHTEKMRNRLASDGVNVDMIPLHVFDYVLPLQQEVKRVKNAVVFAGSLGKSLFLKELYKVCGGHIVFNLYGKGLPEGVTTENIRYKGTFLSDDITSIEGDWGLLWDGDSILGCEGNFGQYLTIIASHKFSLYIACKLKVIVGENSALADLVKEKNIGIVIKDLTEIDSRISQLSTLEITTMEKNIETLAIKIRQGDMFKAALGEILM